MSASTTEGSLKRTYQSEDYERVVYSEVDDRTKKQKNEEMVTVRAYDNQYQLIGDSDDIVIKAEKILPEIGKKTAKNRLEMNRQRAKENRKRQKLMYQEMEKQIVLLKAANTKLSAENKTQQLEIDLLRKISQLLLSKQRSPTERLGTFEILNNLNSTRNTNSNISHTNIPPASLNHSALLNNISDIDNINNNIMRTSLPPNRLDLSKILNSVTGVSNTNENISSILQDLQHQPNVGSNGGVANTNDEISSLLRELQHQSGVSSNSGVANTNSDISNILRDLQNQPDISSNGAFLRPTATSSTNDIEYQALQNIASLLRR